MNHDDKAMMDMSEKPEWSNNTPTEPGLYWVKFNSGSDSGEVTLIAFELKVEATGFRYMISKRDALGTVECGWGFEATGKPPNKWDEIELDTEFWGPLKVPK